MSPWLDFPQKNTNSVFQEQKLVVQRQSCTGVITVE